MPYMQTTRTLRQTANGTTTLIVANIGDAVNIISQESQGWAQIQLVGMVGTGWTLSSTIGDQSPIPPDTSIDGVAFFLTCWRVGLGINVLPHYLAAVAELRSGISNAQVGTDYGPYRFSAAEWDAGRQLAAFGLSDFVRSDIEAWDYQCTMFAAMAQRDQAAITTALARQPSAAELYLAQLIGPKAAAAALNNPNNTIEADLTGVADADLPIGGLTRAQIMDRYAKYLRGAGPGSASPQGQTAFNLIVADLQTAIDAVRNDIIAAGTDVLGVQPSADTVVTNSNQAPQPSGPAPAPPGPGASGTPGSGGVLGLLVAAHESGSAGYNAYNRGNAGDSPGQAMNFATMSLAQITQLQALPAGDPNRLFAVGKYQLIPSTMKDAIAKLNLGSTRMLTPDLQETLFRSYLIAIKRPQVKSYITGAGALLADAELALAKEFASFPDPSTGNSCYGGSGGNRATVTVAQAAAALMSEHSSYSVKVAAGTPPDQAWAALSA
jgi:hypothetical protein